MMTVKDALGLMIQFGSLIVGLIGLFLNLTNKSRPPHSLHAKEVYLCTELTS